MDFEPRLIVAFSIIGLVVLTGVPLTIVALRKRRREKLRRKGIKTYGH